MDAPPKRFYIDHTTSPRDGGYAITTTENCVKAVTSFAWYEFFLKAQDKFEFTVTEEAEFPVEYLMAASDKTF